MSCPVTVACGSPPAGAVGTPYTHTFPTTGGPNLFFSISAGALPPGLTLDPATGVVSGTPTSSGAYSFTVKVIDAQIIATGDDGSFSDFKICISSDDGTTWTQVTTAISDSGWSVIYATALGLWINGTDFASGTKQLQTSPDGVSGNWTARSTPADGSSVVMRMVAGKDKVVALYDFFGLGIMTSTDGVTWTDQTLPSGAGLVSGGQTDITYSPELDLYVVGEINAPFPGPGGEQGAVMTSPDGITWTIQYKTANLPSLCITWGAGLFVLLGGSAGTGNHLQTSPDGINWTIQSNPAGQSIQWAGVHYDNGTFVAVSPDTSTNPGNQAMTSTDGISWTLRATPGTTKKWGCVTYGYGLWLAGAINSANTQPLMKSTDNGATWALISALGFNFGFVNGIAFGPLDNCSDTAPCSITIGGDTFGNNWSGGSTQGFGNHW